MSFGEDAIRRGKRLLRSRLADPATDAFWALRGMALKNPEIRQRPASCLFLCKGNICRSPFAERIAGKVAGEKGLGEMEFLSAGFEVSHSLPSPPEAVLAARRFGVDLDDHLSTRVTEEMIGGSDMVFAMETAHVLRLRRTYPPRRGDIYLLPLFPGGRQAGDGGHGRFNIADPYGRDLERFVDCYGRIARCVEGLLAGIAEVGVRGPR